MRMLLSLLILLLLLRIITVPPDALRIIPLLSSIWEIDFTQTATAERHGQRIGTDPLCGFGVAFAAADNLALRAEFERYNLENNGAEADLDVLGVSGVLKF